MGSLLFGYSVIGLSDGLTVPFALTAGLSGLGDAKLVVVAGAAELLAGAISMGVGGFRESYFQAHVLNNFFLTHHNSCISV